MSAAALGDTSTLVRLAARSTAAVLAVAGLATLARGYWAYLRKSRIIRGARRVSKKAEAALAMQTAYIRPLGTLVKLAGLAGSEVPLTAPVSNLPVVAYTVRYNGKDATQSSRTTLAPFFCDLGDVHVSVDPRRMELDLQGTITGRRQQVHERVLRLGGPMFVVGTLTSSDDVHFFVDSSLRTWSIVSHRPEAELLRDLDFWAAVHFVGSASLLALATGLFVASMWDTSAWALPEPAPGANIALLPARAPPVAVEAGTPVGTFSPL